MVAPKHTKSTANGVSKLYLVTDREMKLKVMDYKGGTSVMMVDRQSDMSHSTTAMI